MADRDRERWDRYREDDRPRDWGRNAGAGFGGGGYGMMRRDEEMRQPQQPQPQSFRGRGPKGWQRSDDRIRELVCERLTDHHDIDATEIEVAVQNGEITLSGTVDDRRTKRLAEDVAESVGGVKDVHNHLRVGGAA